MSKIALNPELARRIIALHKRARVLDGRTNGNTPKDFSGLIKDGQDEEAVRKLGELVVKARNGDPASQRELNTLRSETINNYANAQSGLVQSLAQEVILGDADRPVLENSYTTEKRVRYIAEDGDIRTVKAVKAGKQTFPELKTLKTDTVEYPLRDVYQGSNMAPSALKTFDLAMDLNNKRESLGFDFLTSAGIYGAFVTTGSKLDRTFVLGSRVVAGNLPTTNELVTTGNSGATKFRIDTLRAIIKYGDSFGQLFGSPLRPTGLVYVPSADAGSILDEVSAASVSNHITDVVIDDYTGFRFGNIDWRFVPDVTLDPATGKAYPIFNRAVMRIYKKPSQDLEFVKTDAEGNKESRSLQSPIGFATNEAWRVFAARVAYHS